MKLASVWFDDVVVVRGAKDLGGGTPRQDLRESNFHAADGWDIEVMGGSVGAPLFRLHREGMPTPVYVGGYGCSYIELPPPETGQRKRK